MANLSTTVNLLHRKLLKKRTVSLIASPVDDVENLSTTNVENCLQRFLPVDSVENLSTKSVDKQAMIRLLSG